jgi:RNase P subunit RPR2
MGKKKSGAPRSAGQRTFEHEKGDGQDVPARLNYLLQLAHVCASSVKDMELSRHYGMVVKKLATKSQTRLARSVKRSLCRQCGSVWIAGQTTYLRAEPTMKKKDAPRNEPPVDPEQREPMDDMVFRMICVHCGHSTIM